MPIVPMATFNGTLTDSNTMDMNLWRTLYFQLQTGYCAGGANPLPAITAVNSSIAQYESANLPVPIPLLIGSYSNVKSYAFSNSLLSYNGSTNQVADVSNRPESPYQLNNLLAACPDEAVSFTGTANFVVPTALVWNTTGKTISSIQIDFDNTLGMQNLTIGTPITVSYSDTGTKRWTIKLTFTDNTVWQCYSQYAVVKAAPTNTAARYERDALDDTWTIDTNASHHGGRVFIRYS